MDGRTLSIRPEHITNGNQAATLALLWATAIQFEAGASPSPKRMQKLSHGSKSSPGLAHPGLSLSHRLAFQSSQPIERSRVMSRWLPNHDPDHDR